MNILLANIDRFDTMTCGVVIVELTANQALLDAFIKRCEQFRLSVEILGYVTDHVL
jgi:D-methionine transport system ATP-binding protein